MEWLSYLLVLICPLMMIFMMKGHGGGHKHHNSHSMTELDVKMNNLQNENEKLKKEIADLSTLIKKES
ncbi:DUF2933 domain-containing protein [Niallia sp.]|uniref:DUF2933 domain-containing protein n=1 Tax=Niallia sp. TaxID=2837523 RepID=UPI00289D9B6C|nr:DUF2933 domain-containing protein [Niallia sp.]